MCDALYKTKDRLLRHVREGHPKKLLEYRWCSYMVDSSLNEIRDHEKSKHQYLYKSPEERRSRGQRTLEKLILVIPASPTRYKNSFDARIQ
jgi:hypothetical protein